jgi:hypothetical protein
MLLPMYEEDRQIIHLLSIVYKIGISIFIVFFYDTIFASIHTCCIDFYIYNQQRIVTAQQKQKLR